MARELIALDHQVRLVPPSDVKACLKRGKNDAADTEAICEVVTRPSMRFVPVKSEEQQLLPLRGGLPHLLLAGFPAHQLECSIRVWRRGIRVTKLFLEMKLPVLLMRPCQGAK